MSQSWAELLSVADKNSRSAAQEVSEEKIGIFHWLITNNFLIFSWKKHVEGVKNWIRKLINLNPRMIQPLKWFSNDDIENKKN